MLNSDKNNADGPKKVESLSSIHLAIAAILQHCANGPNRYELANVDIALWGAVRSLGLRDAALDLGKWD